MTTSWDRIDDVFRTWLKGNGATAQEYNSQPLLGRAELKATFDRFRQQQQPQPNGK
jgi:hypothetical protein